jgi:hypothetical protein
MSNVHCSTAPVLFTKYVSIASIPLTPRRGVPRLPAFDERVRAVVSEASLTAGAPNVYCRRRTFTLENREEACDE